MKGLQGVVSYGANKIDEEEILQGLKQHNSTVVEDESKVPLRVCFRACDGRLTAGLSGYFWWDWLYVQYLWVNPADRGKGLGTALMQQAEREALNRPCVGIHLETFSFQAKPFYEKLGYEAFGILDNFPRDHRRIFLKKVLTLSSNA